MKVDQLMTREIVAVAPETSLKDVARLLTAHRISGVAVCDREGRVLGVVSEADIIRIEEGQSPEPAGRLSRLLRTADGDGAVLAARTAGEAMTSPAVTIAPNASVAEAARTMVTRAINRLPVVDAGRLVGIVTRADLVRAFHRSDEEITEEIAEDVLRRTLWLSPEDVHVQVADGVVDLDGKVDNRTEAELVAAFARRVPGVVDVHSELTWRVDDLARRVAAQQRPRHV
jgi:CBS domain-containing protein